MNQQREERAPLPQWVWPGAALLLTVLVFIQVVGFPFVNMDDPSHVTDNPLVVDPLARGWLGLFWTREIGYPAPVLLLSFALDHALWGNWAAPYHAENLLLHLLNMALLYCLGRRLRLSPALAAAAIALFGLHPLVVEPVAWVTGRKDVLSIALVLGAALIAAGKPERSELGGAGRWVVANVLAVLAVLVLPRMVVGPLLIAVFVLGAHLQWSARAVTLRMAPSLLLASSVVLLGMSQVKEVGAVPDRSLSVLGGDVLGAWAHQFAHLVWPFEFLPWYQRVPGDPSLVTMLVAVAVAVLAVVLVVKRAAPRSAERQGALLMAVAYAPVSGVFGIHRWTADSYMYFPLAGLSLALVPALVRVWPAKLRNLGLVTGALACLVLAFLSFNEASRWSSSSRLWQGAIQRYPDSALAYEHEALGLRADGYHDESHAVFLRMAERFPDWHDTLDDYVRAYRAVGDHQRARAALLRGVQAGQARCVRMYWLELLSAPAAPPPSERDNVASAFRHGFEPMKQGLRDPAAFQRVGQILRALGLDEQAARAEGHARSLSATP